MRRKDGQRLGLGRRCARERAGATVGAGMYVGFGRLPSLPVLGVICQSRLVFLPSSFTMPMERELPPHDRTPTGVVDQKTRGCGRSLFGDPRTRVRKCHSVVWR